MPLARTMWPTLHDAIHQAGCAQVNPQCCPLCFCGSMGKSHRLDEPATVIGLIAGWLLRPPPERGARFDSPPGAWVGTGIGSAPGWPPVSRARPGREGRHQNRNRAWPPGVNHSAPAAPATTTGSTVDRIFIQATRQLLRDQHNGAGGKLPALRLRLRLSHCQSARVLTLLLVPLHQINARENQSGGREGRLLPPQTGPS